MENPLIKKYYDEYVGRQIRVGVNPRHELILRLAKEHGLHSGMKVLEIGCGVGTLTGLLAGFIRHGSVHAVDISPASITMATDRLKAAGNITFQVANVVVDPIEGRYDMIILPDVLEHIPLKDHDAVLRRSKNSLKKNGTILIHSPDPHFNEWLHANVPEQLQVVDLALHLPELIAKIYGNELILHYFQRHRIWMDKPEYMALVLQHRPETGASYTSLPPDKSILHRLARTLGLK